MSLEQIIGAFIAVVVAGMPAMVALLKINQLHILINSRLTELIEFSRKASKAEGVIEGRDNVWAELAAERAASATQGEPPCTA